MATINGTNGNDFLVGSDQNGDTISGFQGNDYIVETAPGPTFISEGNGNNTVVGDGGLTRIVVGNGSNLIEPGTGNTSIRAGVGRNTFVINPLNGDTGPDKGHVSLIGYHAGDKINIAGFQGIESFLDLRNSVDDLGNPILFVSGRDTILDLSSLEGQPAGTHVLTVIGDTLLGPRDFEFNPSPVFLEVAQPSGASAGGSVPIGGEMPSAGTSGGVGGAPSPSGTDGGGINNATPGDLASLSPSMAETNGSVLM